MTLCGNAKVEMISQTHNSPEFTSKFKIRRRTGSDSDLKTTQICFISMMEIIFG